MTDSFDKASFAIAIIRRDSCVEESDFRKTETKLVDLSALSIRTVSYPS